MAREMKDSGIDWLSLIPCDWVIKRNKSLFYEVNERCVDGSKHTLLSVSEYTGVTPRVSIIKDGEFETHAESLDGYKICKSGDIVMNIMLAWKRATATSRFDGIVSPAYSVYRGRGSVDTRYYHYLFRTDICADMFKRYSTGIIDSRLRLYPDVFLSLSSPVPSLEEQSRIADFLDTECGRIDAVIEQTRASIEEYKKLKQSVITQAVTKGIRGDRPMKDSGVEWIGEIPAEWDRRKLKSFTAIISKGATPKDIDREFTSVYSVRYLKSENIVDNQLSEFPLFTISEIINETELKRSRLKEDDLLFVIAGASLGKVAIMKSDLLPANTNQAVCFLRLKKEYSSQRKYIWYALQSSLMKTYISINCVQSAQPNISMEDIGSYFIAVPSNNEHREILNWLDAKCNEIDRLIETKQHLLTELETYKKSVIYEYVTGKKEVPYV